LLDAGKSLDYELAPGRHGWLQLVSGELEVNGTKLAKGDGAAVSDETRLRISNAGAGQAEFLFFDLN
jgi:hypothetical protein